MKQLFFYLISALFLISALSTEVFAQSPKSLNAIVKDAEQYRWLYEILFSEQERKEAPAETFKSFRVHLLDSNSYFPNPGLIASANLEYRSKIRGMMTYVGIFKRRYAYDVVQASDGYLELQVRIHLKDATSADLSAFREKVQEAQMIWNQNATSTDFAYRYHFEIVTDPSLAHFSVRILDSTNGPYDTAWSRDWTGKVIAHEVGHMLGLGDEYQTGTSNFDCYRPSMMCTAWTGSPMKHHSYFVLRRLIR